MLDPKKRFSHARLKHIWAHQQIDQLNAFWQRFTETDFCRMSIQTYGDGRGQFLKIDEIAALPAEIGLCLGDAVHNLKCSLDYAISEILGWQNTRITFPMGELRDELVSSFRTGPSGTVCAACGRGDKKGRNAAIEQAAPGIGKFIADTIRSYRAGNNPLWTLNKLDTKDKHRLLIPVVVPLTFGNIELIDNNNNSISFENLTVNGTVTPVGFGSGIKKFKQNGKATADILFNEVGLIEHQSVIPTLIQMAQAVDETLAQLDDFLTASGWQSPA